MNNELKQKMIDEVLPKEKAEHGRFLSAEDSLYNIGYNQAISDTHQVLDQIIEIVREDTLKSLDTQNR